MDEIIIKCNPESAKAENEKVLITAEFDNEKELLYKFIIGHEGKWNVLREFSSENTIEWTPKNCGDFIIMVQGKVKDSKKPYNYASKSNFFVGPEKENLNDKEEPIKEEAPAEDKQKKGETNVEESGSENISSENMEAQETKKVEITNFKNLTADMLAGNELIFEVDASSENNKTILYKFVKIDLQGEVTCLQDFSPKKMISYVEEFSGEYKLLCMVKDIYSVNNYDDRALINYTVKPYREIQIKSFTSDVSSPQACGAQIELKGIVTGGNRLLYRFIVKGPEEEDSGYMSSNSFIWESKRLGRYIVELLVKDESSHEEFQAKKTMDFVIEEYTESPVIINEIVLDKTPKLLLHDTINIKAIASGGIDIRYSFIVYKDGRQEERIEYGSCSFVNFTAEKSGTYQIEVRVKSKYSKREFDSNSIVYVDAYDFMQAEIDYVLMPINKYYVVGDKIELSVVARNTNNTLYNYVLKINGDKAEESGYVKNSKYSFLPKYAGNYTVDILVKNIDSAKDFDTKKEINVRVNESFPITDMIIQCDNKEFHCNEVINFTANCEGGKEVLFEFYLAEKGDWKQVQKYSRKNYYTFMPFKPGKYKVLALVKSNLKQCEYEGYKEYDFEVQ